MSIDFKPREKVIAALRQWARDEIDTGSPVNQVYHGLQSAMHALMHEFRVEHDLPGTRYWLHPESDSYFSTGPGETLGESIDAELCIELKRYEFLSRQNLHFGYKDRL